MLLLLSIRNPTDAGTSSAENISSVCGLRVVNDREGVAGQAGDVAAAAVANRHVQDDQLGAGPEGRTILRQRTNAEVRRVTEPATRIEINDIDLIAGYSVCVASHFSHCYRRARRIRRLPANEPRPISASSGSTPAVSGRSLRGSPRCGRRRGCVVHGAGARPRGVGASDGANRFALRRRFSLGDLGRRGGLGRRFRIRNHGVDAVAANARQFRDSSDRSSSSAPARRWRCASCHRLVARPDEFVADRVARVEPDLDRVGRGRRRWRRASRGSGPADRPTGDRSSNTESPSASRAAACDPGSSP